MVEFLSSRLSRRYLDRLRVEKPPLLPVHKFPLSVVDLVSLTSAEKASLSSCCVLVGVVYKQMQQLPTMLGPGLHLGKDTNHRTL